jgi:predicted nucleotidyltransferase
LASIRIDAGSRKKPRGATAVSAPAQVVPRDKIEEFCRRRRVTEFALFGSVARGEARSESDVDVLVTFAPDAGWSLFDLVEMQDELKLMFGREVHLVERDGLRNPFRRREILRSMKVVYAV